MKESRVLWWSIAVILVQAISRTETCSTSSIGKDGMNSLSTALEFAATELANSILGGTKNIEKAVDGASASIKTTAGSFERISKDLNQSIRNVSNQLSRSLDNGVSEVTLAVEQVAASIGDISKSVKLQLNSADLANVGQIASQNLRESLLELSQNWRLALNTADMKEFGSEASRELAAALRESNLNVSLHISMDHDLVQLALFVSIAGAIGFVVLAVSVLCALTNCGSKLLSVLSFSDKMDRQNRAIQNLQSTSSDDVENQRIFEPGTHQGYGSINYGYEPESVAGNRSLGYQSRNSTQRKVYPQTSKLGESKPVGES